jgi:phage/conjugal plasmid C-4 type zinc finger TraR family protein
MAGGWAKDGAVQEQIDASVEDAVNRARSQMASGEGLAECERCAAPIPLARREAVPGVRRCVECQGAAESERIHTGPINRRASKDSQLR